MAPVSADPDGMGTGWSCPAAGDPDVSAAVPAVVAADPDPAGMRARARALDTNRGWANADINVLSECRWEAEQRGGSNKEKFLHTRGFFLSHGE